jgi:hypothetical protein
MRRTTLIRWRTVWLAALLAAGGGAACAAGLALRDRIVADVAGEPVTLRQVVILASLEAGRKVDPSERELMAAALQHEITQVIIMRDIARNPSYEEETPDGAAMRQALEQKCGGPEGLRRLQEDLQMSDAALERFFLRQALAVAFVRLHFNPFVYVSEEEVRKYYAEVFVPRLGPGAVPPDFESVQQKIVEILQQRKINAEFDQWLERQKKELKVKLIE